MFKFITASISAASVAAAHMKITDKRCLKSDHYVSDLPYFKVGHVQPCSFAGTLPSNEEMSHHMFYWMYPNQNIDAPIAVWLNGGPGASSTFANFLLNGPMGIDHFGAGADDFSIYVKDQGSWADIATMVYVDQPVGTGFSWGDNYLNNMDDAADEFVFFLSGLF
jgi:carboxypeptidase D